MSALATFQNDLRAALYDETSRFGPATQPAFAIYRNTVMRACLDALEANFPAVVCLVGRDWFRAAAAIHVAASPPRDARLSRYGEGFADFLAAFEPAAELPYLADVARLDRLWLESLDAADPSTLPVERMKGIPRVHPATRWHVSSLPARSIWEPSRTGMPAGEGLVWQPECTLFTRLSHEVHVSALEPAGVVLLATIGDGASLAEAVTAATSAHPDASIDSLVSGLLRSGALVIR